MKNRSVGDLLNLAYNVKVPSPAGRRRRGPEGRTGPVASHGYSETACHKKGHKASCISKYDAFVSVPPPPKPKWGGNLARIAPAKRPAGRCAPGVAWRTTPPEISWPGNPTIRFVDFCFHEYC